MFYPLNIFVEWNYLSIFTTMTDCELIQLLCDGNTVSDIEKKTAVDKRLLENRIKVLKDRCGALNTTHLAIKYFRLKLVE